MYIYVYIYMYIYNILHTLNVIFFISGWSIFFVELVFGVCVLLFLEVHQRTLQGCPYQLFQWNYNSYNSRVTTPVTHLLSTIYGSYNPNL